MAETTRRRFLRAGAVAGAGLVAGWPGVSAQGLGGQFAMPSQPPCTDTRKATPEVKTLEAVRPAPTRSQIAEGVLNGPTIEFVGTVIGLTCGNVKGARVDLWHADPAGTYPEGLNYRGAQVTDEHGRVTFVTIVPGALPGRAPHLNVRIQPPGTPMFSTQLFFPADPRNAKDAAFKPELVMKSDAKNNRLAVFTFDFILSI